MSELLSSRLRDGGRENREQKISSATFSRFI